MIRFPQARAYEFLDEKHPTRSTSAISHRASWRKFIRRSRLTSGRIASRSQRLQFVLECPKAGIQRERRAARARIDVKRSRRAEGQGFRAEALWIGT